MMWTLGRRSWSCNGPSDVATSALLFMFPSARCRDAGVRFFGAIIDAAMSPIAKAAAAADRFRNRGRCPQEEA